jgi:hypothetical protein
MIVLLLAAQAASASITVERIDGNSFRMTIPAPATSQAGELQARMLPSARLSCQKRRPLFARYRILPREAEKEAKAVPPGEPILEQELICVEQTLPRAPAAATADPEWAPQPGDHQALLAATYGYFAAKDAGRYAEAHQFLSERMRAATPIAPWTEAARTFNVEAGRALGRRVVEISWYNHPADAPEPGIYVAADFSAEFERLEFVCGYVMWRLLPDGSFRLVREEQNLARKRGSRPMAGIDRNPMRVRLGCKD